MATASKMRVKRIKSLGAMLDSDNDTPQDTNSALALFQIKWKTPGVDDDYQSASMKGPIELIRSRRKNSDIRLIVEATEEIPGQQKPGDKMDIPLPPGEDWKVASENHESPSLHMIKLSFLCPASNRKIKIQIGLPYEDEESRLKAQLFGKTLSNANINPFRRQKSAPSSLQRRSRSRSGSGDERSIRGSRSRSGSGDESSPVIRAISSIAADQDDMSQVTTKSRSSNNLKNLDDTNHSKRSERRSKRRNGGKQKIQRSKSGSALVHLGGASQVGGFKPPTKPKTKPRRSSSSLGLEGLLSMVHQGGAA